MKEGSLNKKILGMRARKEGHGKALFREGEKKGRNDEESGRFQGASEQRE